MEYTKMTISEYIQYIKDEYDECYFNMYPYEFDKPVMIVARGYESDTDIKQLHLKTSKYISLMSQLDDVFDDFNIERPYLNDMLEDKVTVWFGEEPLIKDLESNTTLIFKNLTFADNYFELDLGSFPITNATNVKLIFENVDFGYVRDVQLPCLSDHYGEDYSDVIDSITLKDVKMPCVKRLWSDRNYRLVFDNTYAPFLTFPLN